MSAAESDQAVPIFAAAYAPDDAGLIRRYIAETRLDAATETRIDQRATGYIAAIRGHSGAIGGLEDFLREFGLSTREGLALMVLAEALLRVPDAATQDRLIEDKLAGADWGEHAAHAETWFVSASTWALGLSSRIVQPGETPEGVVAGLVKRVGQPAVRRATRQAMRVLGHHFVLGETIAEALRRARTHGGAGLSPFLRHAGRGRSYRRRRRALFRVLRQGDRSHRQRGGEGDAAGPSRHLGQALRPPSALRGRPARARC